MAVEAMNAGLNLLVTPLANSAKKAFVASANIVSSAAAGVAAYEVASGAERFPAPDGFATALTIQTGKSAILAVTEPGWKAKLDHATDAIIFGVADSAVGVSLEAGVAPRYLMAGVIASAGLFAKNTVKLGCQGVKEICNKSQESQGDVEDPKATEETPLIQNS